MNKSQRTSRRAHLHACSTTTILGLRQRKGILGSLAVYVPLRRRLANANLDGGQGHVGGMRAPSWLVEPMDLPSIAGKGVPQGPTSIDLRPLGIATAKCYIGTQQPHINPTGPRPRFTVLCILESTCGASHALGPALWHTHAELAASMLVRPQRVRPALARLAPPAVQNAGDVNAKSHHHHHQGTTLGKPHAWNSSGDGKSYHRRSPALLVCCAARSGPR